MYTYTKKKNFPKRRLIVSLCALMAVSVSYLSYEYWKQSQERDTPVFKEQDVPVLTLPDTTQQTIVKPFKVDANIAIDFFDGKENEIDNMTKFEGVYRGNQGIDYTFQEESFDILSSVDGIVSEVKEDTIFGNSVTVVNKDLSITYQSLHDVCVKQGDNINQMDPIGKAGKNIYNKELGNHLHIVVEKNGKILDPKTVFDKALGDIK